jgi:hypothetical protein
VRCPQCGMHVADVRHHYHDSLPNYVPRPVPVLQRLTGRLWRRSQPQPEPISVRYWRNPTTTRD